MRQRALVVFRAGIFGAVLALSFGAFLACGGGDGAACAVGSEGCPCTGGGVCNLGLSCLSNRCVSTTGTDGGAAGNSGGGGNVGAGGGGGNAGSTDPEVACGDVSMICAKINQCAPAAIKISYGTVENCIARFKLSCIDAFKAPDSGLTMASIAACSAALPAASCSDVLDRKVSACNAKGTRANGSACGTSEQCLTGHCTQNDLACGVCAAFVGAGAACTGTDDCEPGLECSDDNRCILPGAAGTACSVTQTCKLGLYCRNGSCVNGSSTAGATCQDLVESCDILKGLYCNLGVNTCANLGFAAPGDPCGLVASRLVVCSAGACIRPSATATEGICASPAADGASCGDQASNNNGCQDPARCVANRCKLPSSAACL